MGGFTRLVVGRCEHEIASVSAKRKTTQELIRRAKQLIKDFETLAEEHLRIKARRKEADWLALERGRYGRYRRKNGDSDAGGR